MENERAQIPKVPLKYSRNVGKLRIIQANESFKKNKVSFPQPLHRLGELQRHALTRTNLDFNHSEYWHAAQEIEFIYFLTNGELHPMDALHQQNCQHTMIFVSRRQTFLKNTTSFSEPLISWLLLWQHFMHVIRSRHISSSNSQTLHTTCNPVKCFYLIHKEQLGRMYQEKSFTSVLHHFKLEAEVGNHNRALSFLIVLGIVPSWQVNVFILSPSKLHKQLTVSSTKQNQNK